MKTAQFTLIAVPDIRAARPNLVHCSLFQRDRLGWWDEPTAGNARSYGVDGNQYGIDGYNAYRLHAKDGCYIDLRQPIGADDPKNTDIEGTTLKTSTWYTLSFKCRGVHRHINSDGSYTDRAQGTVLYVYVYPSVIDTAAKIIVDGEERQAPRDMRTPIHLTWAISEHTITFKTASSFTSHPRVLFRSFGEGTTAYDTTTFADGGCFARIACVKIEEGDTATPYTPHHTELQPPVHAVAFKRDNTDISGTAPTGGTYSSPTPTGWSDGIPSGEARLWETKAVFVPELPSATWSKPSPVGDTSDSDVEFSPYDGTPTSDVSNNLAAAGTAATPTTNKWFDPVRNAGADFTKMIWRAERNKKNGVWDENWAIVKVKGETGDAGQDAIVLDLDNQMDSIAVDSDGNIRIAQTVTTHATIYKGATAQSITSGSVTATSINGVDANEITYSGGVATISYTFLPQSDGFDDRHYTSEISVTYGGVTYKAIFTLAPVRGGADGKNAVIYNVIPSMTSCAFFRTSANTVTPSSYSLNCGYRRTEGNETTTIANAKEDFNGNWHIFYRTHEGNTINDWIKYEESVEATSAYTAYEFCIAKTNDVNVLLDDVYDQLIVDRETVPVVVGGKNGSSGDSPVIYSIRLTKQVCNVDSDGMCHVDIRWQVVRTIGDKDTVMPYKNDSTGTYHKYKYASSDTWLTSNLATNLSTYIHSITPGDGVRYAAIGSPAAIDIAFDYDGMTRATASVPFTVNGENGTSSDPASVILVDTDIKAIPCTSDGVAKTGAQVTVTAYERSSDGTMSAISPFYLQSTLYYSNSAGSSTLSLYSVTSTSGSLTFSIPSERSGESLVVEKVRITVYRGSSATGTMLKRITLYPLCDGQQGIQGPTGDEGKPLPTMLVSTPSLGFTLEHEDYGNVVGDASVKFTAVYGTSSAETKYRMYNDYLDTEIGSEDTLVRIRVGGTSTGRGVYWNVYAKVLDGVLTVTPDSVDETAISKSGAACSFTVYAEHPDCDELIEQEFTMFVVRRGEKGESLSYTPYIIGVYTPNTSYVWNEQRRDFVYYPDASGNYKIWGVKTLGMDFQNRIPGETYDDAYGTYWEQGSDYKLLIANCIFGDNAVLGGMKFTSETMTSTSVTEDKEPNILIDGKNGTLKANNATIRGEINATKGNFSNSVIDGSCTIVNNDGWNLIGSGSDNPGCMLVGSSSTKDVTLRLSSGVNTLSMTNAASSTANSTNTTPMIRATCYNGIQVNASKKAIEVESGESHFKGNVFMYGGNRLNVVTITSSTTIAATADLVVINNSASITVKLPSAEENRGKVLYIKKIGEGGLILDGGRMYNASGTATGNTTNSFGKASMMYISDGTYWIEFYCGY